MAFVLPWIAELIVGALPLILYYLIDGFGKRETATLVCRCIGRDTQTCLVEKLVEVGNATQFDGSCVSIVNNADAEVYLFCIITLGIGLLSRYIVKRAPDSAQAPGSSDLPLVVRLVALFAVVVLVIVVVLYVFVVRDQMKTGFFWTPWLFLVCATLCSAVFKWSIEEI
jgi:hypothetical protein